MKQRARRISPGSFAAYTAGTFDLLQGGFNCFPFTGSTSTHSRRVKAARFFQQMQSESVDIVCIQETGADLHDFPQYSRLEGYEAVWEHDPAAPGRTGVAIFARHPIRNERRRICDHESCAGRFIEATIGGVKVASVYAHAHDAKDADRRAARLLFYKCLGNYIRAGAHDRCIVVLDANVSLVREDVGTPTQWTGPWASKTYRRPITQAMADADWKDSFRVLYPDARRATVWISTNFQCPDGEQGYGITGSAGRKRSRRVNVLQTKVRTDAEL